jgi:hypothetical protein
MHRFKLCLLLFIPKMFRMLFLACSVGWWLVLVSSERRVLVAGCWWLICSERRVLLAGG